MMVVLEQVMGSNAFLGLQELPDSALFATIGIPVSFVSLLYY